MDALVSVCSWNTNFITVWAWMLWSPYALAARALLWFGHGCSGCRMLLQHERYYGLGMNALVAVCSDALATVCFWHANVIVVCAWMLWSPYVLMLWLPYALGTRALSWFGHECSGHRMLLEHERCYGLGMDALVTVCSWNTSVVMVWAWLLWPPYVLMLWLPYALGTRTSLWFVHGCSGHRMF